MSGSDQWLREQVEDAKQRFDAAESDSQAYQYAAEAETYNRILKGTLPFESPEEAVRVYENHLDDPDFGMTAARVRAIERYLNADS